MKTIQRLKQKQLLLYKETNAANESFQHSSHTAEVLWGTAKKRMTNRIFDIKFKLL